MCSATALQPSDGWREQVFSPVAASRQHFHTEASDHEDAMKAKVLHWFHWLGEAMVHALGSEQDRHLKPPPIGPQPYRDVPSQSFRND